MSVSAQGSLGITTPEGKLDLGKKQTVITVLCHLDCSSKKCHCGFSEGVGSFGEELLSAAALLSQVCLPQLLPSLVGSVVPWTLPPPLVQNLEF